MELDFIKTMFDTIAPKYDFLNRLLSMGQDIRWRREMVAAAALGKNPTVLDVACGTSDVGIEICRQTNARANVVGVDFSPGMLYLGKKKIDGRKEKCPVDLVAGNALALPFGPSLFNAVFIAFGIRNIMDRPAALASFYTAMKKGGKLVVLELSTPEQFFLKQLYMLYFKRILPMLGGLFSKDPRAYHYLPQSVIRFPAPPQFAETMTQAGFTDIHVKPMTFGIVTLFVGTKP